MRSKTMPELDITARLLPEVEHEELADWVRRAHEAFVRRVMDDEYPCYFGTIAERGKAIWYTYCPANDVSQLPRALSAFTRIARSSPERTLMVAFFEPEPQPLSHDEYGKRFWETLDMLARNDDVPWPATMPRVADDPLWEFCFAGMPMFVFAGAPSYVRRRSRNFGDGFVMLFQPRMVFDGIEGDTPKGRTARTAIRQRLGAWDGQAAHPDLDYYGSPGNREWKSYFLPDDNTSATGTCPLRSATPSLRQPARPAEPLVTLTRDDQRAYRERGFVIKDAVFAREELDAIRSELWAVAQADHPGKIFESDGTTLRSVYGVHAHSERLARTVCDERFVVPATTLVGSDVYVYQTKVNAKASFTGDLWEWHQDYIFWRDQDGVPSADLVNVALFMEDVTEFNGPLWFVPGSHGEGVIAAEPNDEIPPGYETAPRWVNSLTARLKYSVSHDGVRRLVERYGIVAPKGLAGSLLFFHPNVVHASAPNISPFDRTMLTVTYNSCANSPAPDRQTRPWFLSGRDTKPLRRSSAE